MPAEKSFENKVKDYLTSIGCYPFGTPNHKIALPVVGYWEKRWGGGQFSKSGLPDMHVVLHGTSIELELKAPTGKPSELQLKNLDLVIRSDSYGYILVEHERTAIRLSKWIETKYTLYKDIPVIDFKNFKSLCEKLLTL